jgi:hypothetical protein
MICWGLAAALTEIKPFWVDEWRVIYNLKFKTAAGLWGQLDFLQQFPRVYLSILKSFTQHFDYSYTALRVPSLIVGTFLIVFCYRLMNRLYRPADLNRFLFVMELISCSTFTDYFVQIKQYTMDMLLSLVAIWQLLELLKLKEREQTNKVRYLVLCLTFLVVPFFSYTYPVAVAPVYAVVLLQNIRLFTHKDPTVKKRRVLLLQWLPLFICTFSITVFYIIDVSQLMKDSGMKEFWGHLMMDNGFSIRSFLINCYMLFAEIGSGFMFWLLFGIFGLVSFLTGIYTSTRNVMALKTDKDSLVLLYGTLLLLLVVVLFIFGKIPVGEPRLNAFTIPSVCILLIGFLNRLSEENKRKQLSNGIAIVLLAGVTGNIYSTFAAAVSGADHEKKVAIYKNSEQAIKLAQQRNIPILITPGIAYPYEHTRNLPFHNTVPGDWVLMTLPAYKVSDPIPVYAIDSTAKWSEYMEELPEGIREAVVGDGTNYTTRTRLRD